MMYNGIACGLQRAIRYAMQCAGIYLYRDEFCPGKYCTTKGSEKGAGRPGSIKGRATAE